VVAPLTLSLLPSSQDAYKTKERYLRSKAMLEKYNEELEAVDEAAPSDEDARKFELLRVRRRRGGRGWRGGPEPYTSTLLVNIKGQPCDP